MLQNEIFYDLLTVYKNNEIPKKFFAWQKPLHVSLIEQFISGKHATNMNSYTNLAYPYSVQTNTHKEKKSSSFGSHGSHHTIHPTNKLYF